MGRGRYFCDYCDTFLTHDSPSVRKTHNNGRKHKENVRYYYQKWVEEKAQSLIDQTTAQYSKVAGGATVPPPAAMARAVRPPGARVMGPPGPGIPPGMVPHPQMHMAPPPFARGMPPHAAMPHGVPHGLPPGAVHPGGMPPHGMPPMMMRPGMHPHRPPAHGFPPHHHPGMRPPVGMHAQPQPVKQEASNAD